MMDCSEWINKAVEVYAFTEEGGTSSGASKTALMREDFPDPERLTTAILNRGRVSSLTMRFYAT